jgi:hypothetical protein
MTTRYVLRLWGLVTWNSEKTGCAPTFSTAKLCSRPNCRRSAACQASSDIPSGRCSRESFRGAGRFTRLTPSAH